MTTSGSYADQQGSGYFLPRIRPYSVSSRQRSRAGILTSEERRDELLRNMINSGAEIAGGAVGGALGFLAGGPFGAAALGAGSAAAAVAFKRIGG